MKLFQNKSRFLQKVLLFLFCLLLVISTTGQMASAQEKTVEEESARELKQRHRKTIQLYREGFRLKKAWSELEKYRSLYPEDPWILFEESEIAYKAQQWQKAADKARQAAEAGYDPVETQLLLGKIYFEMNNPERAEASFQQAIQSASEEAEVFYQAGRFYLSTQDYAKAAKLFTKAVQLEPDSKSFLLGLATAVGADQGVEAALPYYERHIELSVPAEKQDLEIAKLYLWKNKPQRAIALLQRKMEKEPENTELWKLLAEAQGQSGDIDAALKTYQKAVQLVPEDPSLSVGMAKVYRVRGELEESFNLLEEVLKAHPENAEALYGRALIFTDAGRPEDALRDIEKIKGSAEENLNVMALRTALAYTTGKLEENDEYFQKLQQYGSNAQSLVHQFLERIEEGRVAGSAVKSATH